MRATFTNITKDVGTVAKHLDYRLLISTGRRGRVTHSDPLTLFGSDLKHPETWWWLGRSEILRDTRGLMKANAIT